MDQECVTTCLRFALAIHHMGQTLHKVGNGTTLLDAEGWRELGEQESTWTAGGTHPDGYAQTG
jgi:hypothetical protein